MICSTTSCPPGRIEHWALNEGFADIAEYVVAGVVPPDPPADSVADIMEEHCDTEDPSDADAVYGCVRSLGRLLFKSFKGLAARKTDAIAFVDYYREVVKELPYNQEADFADFHTRLGQKIYDEDIRPEVDKPPAPSPVLAFEIIPWYSWLQSFFEYDRDRDNGETIPHGGWG